MSTILITGGHAGIGLECSRRLAAEYGLDLILAGRSPDRMAKVANQLRAIHGVKVATLALDMSSLASVRTAARQCIEMLDGGEIGPLEAILCNAGAQFRGPISYSVDGYEETFATNCLGNFLLVEMLLDRLSTSGRVVFTASGTHDPDTADGRMVGIAAAPDAIALSNDGKIGAKPLSGGIRYTTSKLCTILYAYELDRKLRQVGSAISSIAFDPGCVPETGLLRTMPKPVQWIAKTSFVKALFRRRGITMSSVAFSGGALAKIAADPLFGNASGKYIQASDDRMIDQRSSIASYDERSAAKLWRDTEVLVNLLPGDRSAVLRGSQAAGRVAVTHDVGGGSEAVWGQGKA